MKSVRIRSFSGPYFCAFGPDTEKYGVSLHIQSECWKIQTRKSPSTDTFHAVLPPLEHFFFCHIIALNVLRMITRFFYKQRFFSTQPQCRLTFKWIELQMLLRCWLIHVSIVIMRHFLYLLHLCPCLDLGLFYFYFIYVIYF